MSSGQLFFKSLTSSQDEFQDLVGKLNSDGRVRKFYQPDDKTCIAIVTEGKVYADMMAHAKNTHKQVRAKEACSLRLRAKLAQKLMAQLTE